MKNTQNWKGLIGLCAMQCLTAFVSFSQEIDFKKGFVLWDGEQVMEYRIENAGREFSLYPLGQTEGEEIVFIVARTNNTEYKEDDFNKVYFSESKKSYELAQPFMFKSEIVKLIRKGVIQRNATVDEEKLDSYIEKYGEVIPHDHY
jgi:hypothetical protein